MAPLGWCVRKHRWHTIAAQLSCAHHACVLAMAVTYKGHPWDVTAAKTRAILPSGQNYTYAAGILPPPAPTRPALRPPTHPPTHPPIRPPAHQPTRPTAHPLSVAHTGTVEATCIDKASEPAP